MVNNNCWQMEIQSIRFGYVSVGRFSAPQICVTQCNVAVKHSPMQCNVEKTPMQYSSVHYNVTHYDAVLMQCSRSSAFVLKHSTG